MSFDPQTIVEAVASHALATGRYSRVNQHEPKSDPGRGITCAIWYQEGYPVPGGSGLAATSWRLEFIARSYLSMLTEPQDMIDPEVLRANHDLKTLLFADYTLGGLVRDIDLQGSSERQSIRDRAGYLQIGGRDGGMKRVLDLFIPMTINDLYPHV